MNVYDQAHSLAAAIKESEEFKQYAAIKKTVAANHDLNEMLADFQKKQLAFQAKQMMGEEPDQNDMQAIQDLYQIMTKDPLAAQYLQCEMRFSLMMQDVYKVIGEVAAIGTVKAE